MTHLHKLVYKILVDIKNNKYPHKLLSVYSANWIKYKKAGNILSHNFNWLLLHMQCSADSSFNFSLYVIFLKIC